MQIDASKFAYSLNISTHATEIATHDSANLRLVDTAPARDFLGSEPLELIATSQLLEHIFNRQALHLAEKECKITCILHTLQASLRRMTQRMATLVNGRIECLELPAPHAEVLPGIAWGRFDQFFTPAFWYSQAWHVENRERISLYRLGETLQEEVVACLLGGYGMRAEVGLAAFARLKERGLMSHNQCSEAAVFAALMEPLPVCGRNVRYRYPRQRARFVAHAVGRLHRKGVPLHSDIKLRSWLLEFDGIGPKTASWITRNFLDSDNVAIIDIHVFRAGVLLGLFDPAADVSRHYMQLESRLVSFAKALKVRLACLDTLIWAQMRRLGSVARVSMANTRNRNFDVDD